MKKGFSLIVSIIMIFATCVTVYASEPVPVVYEVCNGLPYHNMMPKGFGHVILNSTGKRIFSGQGWRCNGCTLVMVTEGDPTLVYPSTQYIGRYATYFCTELGYNPTPNDTGFTISVDNYGETNSFTLNGYKFN